MRLPIENRVIPWIRNQRGFSLITVTVISLIATLWLSAMLAAMIPAYRNAATNKFGSQLRSAAESYANYIVSYLNANPTTYVYGQPTSFSGTLPSTDSMSLPTGTTIIANITSIAPIWAANANQRSYLYDPQTISYSSDIATQPNGVRGGTAKSNFGFSPIGNLPNMWTLVDVTVSYAGVSKEVKLFLKPILNPISLNSNSAPGGTSSAYFSTGMLATSLLSLGNGTTTNGIDSSNGLNVNLPSENAFWSTQNLLNNPSLIYQPNPNPNLPGTGDLLGGDVTTYNQVAFDSGVKIGGSLVVDANSPSVQINSSDTVGRQFGSSTVTPTFNVDGSYNSSSFTNPGNFVDSSASTGSQSALPPSPTPMSSSVTFSGTNPTGSAISVGATQSTSIGAGDYTVGSLTVGDGGTLSTTGNSMTRIFIDSNTLNSNLSGTGTIPVAAINGNINANGVPGNFEIWYDGTGTLAIGSTATQGSPSVGPITINATIYAPNATVLLSGSSSSGVNFNGAIVANTIAGSISPVNGNFLPTNNVRFQFDNDLNGSQGTLSAAQQQSLFYNPNSIQNPNPTLQTVYYWESQ